MKVALDLAKAHDFGIGTYIRNLVHHLARLDEENTYFLLGTRSANSFVLPQKDNFHPVEIHDGKRAELDRGKVIRFLKQNKIDVCHIPYDEVPWRIPCHYVVTVHDCVNTLFPAKMRPQWMQALHFQLKRHRLLRASHIIAVSEATKHDVERLYAIPDDHITVIHNALDEELATLPANLEPRSVLERYQIVDPYLLYAGSVRPHKNLTRLIEAFAVARTEFSNHPAYARLKLLIIGDELAKHQALRRAVVISRVQNEVRFLGFVSPDILRVFYQNAAAFVFPSLYEGFGLPPLEAMSFGTPVLTSNTSSLPEVVGDAAVLVNPENVFEIARGIRQILCDETLRAQLIQRGFAQIRSFSWMDSARKTLQLYQQAAD
ncbi:MAG: glycosyltransferase family 1 protein [Acidobacteriia bacterium]|nr:glycosyltransferase family 1 protein [Terriglobia bacterium]